jgi:antitoxin (DNA-binding transcriptional repressor) of toxin-antitoxin stability system
VERAAKGEEVIIAKAGKPMVKMVPVDHPSLLDRLDSLGPNPMGITYIAPDFDEPAWTEEELDEFGL